MNAYVVTSGLSRRLIEARDEEHARIEFCKDHPIRRQFAALDELLEVHVASPAELREFEKRPRGAAPTMDGQVVLDLGPVSTREAKRATSEKSKKEPA